MTPKPFAQFLAEVDAASAAHVPVRKPIGHATYNGDLTGILHEGPKGPNYMGEVMWPVTADYDPETGKTRVGFSLVPDPAWQQLAPGVWGRRP